MRAQNTAGKRHRDVRQIVIKEKEIKALLFRGHCPPYTSSNTVWLKVHGHAPLSQKNLADQSCMNEEHGRYKQKQSGHPKESALFVCACVRVTLIITTQCPRRKWLVTTRKTRFAESNRTSSSPQGLKILGAPGMLVTKRYPACGGRICHATERFPERWRKYRSSGAR